MQYIIQFWMNKIWTVPVNLASKSYLHGAKIVITILSGVMYSTDDSISE